MTNTSATRANTRNAKFSAAAIFRALFGGKARAADRRARAPRSAMLRIEGLESRELLSAAPALESPQSILQTASLAEFNYRSIPLDFASENQDAPIACNALYEFDAELSNATAQTITVRSTEDSADKEGTLRYAINHANDGDTIVFASSLKGKTIKLNGTQLVITKSITIDASSLYDAETQTPGITIDAGGKSRALYVHGNTPYYVDNNFCIKGLIIKNALSDDSSTDSGAGLYVEGNIELINCIISDNTAFGVGGGIFVYGDGTFIGCSIYGNEVLGKGGVEFPGNGGGVFIYGGLGKFTNCVVSDNVSQYGGGVYALDATLNFVNSLIVENYASINIGGVAINNGNVTFTNCTISSNSAKNYVGGVAGSSLTFYNSIIALNHSANDIGKDSNADTILFYNSLHNGGVFIDKGGNLLYDANKPLFKDAEGGDYRLDHSSQAIDRGNNSYLSNGIDSDLAGKPRTTGDSIDIGAYEYQTSVLSQPKNITISTTPSTITVKWDAVAGATDYEISIDNGKTYVSTNNKTTWNYPDRVIDKITAATEYTISVRAKNATLTSSPTTKTIQTEALYVRATPTITEGSSSRTDQIKVKWNSVSGVGGYTVYYAPSGSNETPKEIKSSYTGVTINDLAANTSYDFWVCANGDHINWADSAKSAKETFKTLGENPSTKVTTELDVVDPADGLISLREAVEKYAKDGDTIYFDSRLMGKTITVNSPIEINKSVEIRGNVYDNSERTTISGGNKTRVFTVKAQSVELNRLKITQGNYADGAGVYIDKNASVTKMSACVITGNVASSRGAGLYVADGAVVKNMNESEITENVATTSGGGVYVDGGTVEFGNALIADNTAPNGAGIYVRSNSSASSLKVYNATIAGNKSSSQGGGIYVENDSAVVNLYNTIVVKNQGSSGADVYKRTSGATVNGYYTLSTYANWTVSENNYSYDPNAVLFVNPELGNYQLDGHSFAVDAGNNQYVNYSYDLLGKTRKYCGNELSQERVVDLGAYEYQATIEAPSIVVTTYKDVVSDTDGEISLREAIEIYANDGDTITFKSSLWGITITLTERLEITKSIKIDASSLKSPVAISGNQKTGLFRITGAETHAEFIGINATKGAAEKGAAFEIVSGNVEFVRCSITSNVADTNGGAIYIGQGTVTLKNSLIASNTANVGGGIYVDAKAGDLNIYNCTIANNTGTSKAGALYIGNSKTSTNLYNTIVAKNASPVGNDVYRVELTAEINGYQTLSSYTDWSNWTMNYEYDENSPLFASSYDFSLAENSQAINKGLDQFGTYNALVETDLVGHKRKISGAVDLGAYEFREDSHVVTTLEDDNDAYNDVISLREAISYAKNGDVVSFLPELDGGTISLTEGSLYVNKSLMIDASNLSSLILDGVGKSGVIEFNGSSQDEYTIRNLTIVGGKSSYGAGVYVSYGKANLINCSIVGNTASSYGGGLYVNSNAEVELTNVLIANNSAYYGGGVYVVGGNEKTTTFVNTTIAGNSATQSGAGFYLNSARGTVVFKNSIIALNGDGTQDVVRYNNQGVINGYRTLSTFSDWSNLASGENLSYDATNPLFEDEANGDYRLSIGSQGIDAGDSAYLSNLGVSKDLAGSPRVRNGSVDLGAYESEGAISLSEGVLTGRETISWNIKDAVGDVSISWTTGTNDVQRLGTFDASKMDYVWDTTKFAEGAGFLVVEYTNAKGFPRTLQFKRTIINDPAINIIRDDITQNTTFSADKTYLVVGDVKIKSGIAVDFASNTVVKFWNNSFFNLESGATVDCGTNVILTRAEDDDEEVHGDTNKDGEATQPRIGRDYFIGSIEGVVGRFNTKYVVYVKSGTITENVTWLRGQTYRITGDLTIASNATLSIPEGVVVKFDRGVSLIVNKGSKLIVNGTTQEPVVFTSVYDSNYGGDFALTKRRKAATGTEF